jgi:hypothetical protein
MWQKGSSRTSFRWQQSQLVYSHISRPFLRGFEDDRQSPIATSLRLTNRGTPVLQSINFRSLLVSELTGSISSFSKTIVPLLGTTVYVNGVTFGSYSTIEIFQIFLLYYLFLLNMHSENTNHYVSQDFMHREK